MASTQEIERERERQGEGERETQLTDCLIDRSQSRLKSRLSQSVRPQAEPFVKDDSSCEKVNIHRPGHLAMLCRDPRISLVTLPPQSSVSFVVQSYCSLDVVCVASLSNGIFSSKEKKSAA